MQNKTITITKKNKVANIRKDKHELKYEQQQQQHTNA